MTYKLIASQNKKTLPDVYFTASLKYKLIKQLQITQKNLTQENIKLKNRLYNGYFYITNNLESITTSTFHLVHFIFILHEIKIMALGTSNMDNFIRFAITEALLICLYYSINTKPVTKDSIQTVDQQTNTTPLPTPDQHSIEEEDNAHHSKKTFNDIGVNTIKVKLKQKILNDIGTNTTPLDHNIDCPIGYHRMKNPVITCAGQTFEFEHIAKWLTTQSTDPLTGETLAVKTLTPNLRLLSKLIKLKDKDISIENTKKLCDDHNKKHILTIIHNLVGFSQGEDIDDIFLDQIFRLYPESISPGSVNNPRSSGESKIESSHEESKEETQITQPEPSPPIRSQVNSESDSDSNSDELQNAIQLSLIHSSDDSEPNAEPNNHPNNLANQGLESNEEILF
ncbi:hypothetical protein DID75_01565 [Candidatus Marinamargulisbacteria bacterium SCGC AG-410-N11]|nr:hypothetical protein DID75_01565 [Candidatus Marinamargulisbacteria bacterium SCGC AG-410-N11]